MRGVRAVCSTRAIFEEDLYLRLVGDVSDDAVGFFKAYARRLTGSLREKSGSVVPLRETPINLRGLDIEVCRTPGEEMVVVDMRFLGGSSVWRRQESFAFEQRHGIQGVTCRSVQDGQESIAFVSGGVGNKVAFQSPGSAEMQIYDVASSGPERAAMASIARQKRDFCRDVAKVCGLRFAN